MKSFTESVVEEATLEWLEAWATRSCTAPTSPLASRPPSAMTRTTAM